MVSKLETEKLSLAQKIEYLELSASNYLKNSNDALSNVRRNDLLELRCLRLPVTQIIEIIKAIVYLLGHKDSGDWENIKKYLADAYFITNLTKLHEEFIISDEIKEIVYPILYESGFDVNTLKKFSMVISYLYLWADNFFKYAEKRQCLAKLKKDLSDMERSEEYLYNKN